MKDWTRRVEEIRTLLLMCTEMYHLYWHELLKMYNPCSWQKSVFKTVNLHFSLPVYNRRRWVSYIITRCTRYYWSIFYWTNIGHIHLLNHSLKNVVRWPYELPQPVHFRFLALAFWLPPFLCNTVLQLWSEMEILLFSFFVVSNILLASAFDCNEVDIECKSTIHVPFQIASPTSDHRGLVVNDEGLQILMGIKENISVLGLLKFHCFKLV